MYTVLLTTSGIGSRLGEFTKDKNKALIDVAGLPSIIRLVETYPKGTHFVITVGYLGAQVKQFITEQVHDYTYEFVTVDTYTGPGSSLGYSMLQAKSLLQKPFIFHACDTLVPEALIPSPAEENWIAGFKIDGDASQYRTLKIADGSKVSLINDKGKGEFDLIHIGLVGFHDYESFWKNLEALRDENPDDQELNDTFVINRMMNQGVHFNLFTVPHWLDTGNPVSLERTRSFFLG